MITKNIVRKFAPKAKFSEIGEQRG
jgi:hypothetical protein